MLLTILKKLPGALFVVDDDATIVYANASAQSITGATQEDLFGKSLWRCAPQLVSTSLYQAVQKAKQTREPTEVEYVSSVTSRWLHASLSPIDEGLSIFFHEHLEPLYPPNAFSLNEQMYRDLLESFSDGVTILTPDGLVLDINQRPLVDAHLLREDVVGKPFTDLPAWSHDPAVQQQLHAAIARASQGETVHFEARIHPRVGMYLDILMTITSHRDANQQIEYLICAGRDITERKHTEEELRTLVDAVPQLVWIADPDGYITYNNQRLVNYLAMTLKWVEGSGWLRVVHPDDRQRVREAWLVSIETGKPYEVEHRLRDGTSGAYRWFLVRGISQRNAEGMILRWLGTCTDIHDKKQAEEELRVLIDAIPQFVWIMTSDGASDYGNQRWYDYTAMTFQQTRGDGWLQAVHPDDYLRTLTLWHHACASGEPFEIEYRFKNGKTGDYRWFLGRAMPMRDETGQIIKWFGTSTDIEDQKHIEEALRQSQERIDVLMNSSIIGIFVAEGEQIVEANETYLHMTGYTREDLRAGSINWARMTPPEYAVQTQQAHQELAMSHHVTRYEKEYVCKDGSRLPVVVGGVALLLDPLQVIGFMLDNSARKELEQRKDDFISMASHELKNPLTALNLQTSMLRRQLARPGIQASATVLSGMETQIDKITRLVEELLDVSKIQAGRLEYRQETVDLDALLQEIVDIMQQTHPSHSILMHSAVQVSLSGDRDRLGQVFINLLSNAIKYSPDAQTVEIDLDASPETVIIRVRDHGLGIPREQRDKIFERFYRATHPRQRSIPGLGMGLYIVAEVVKRHGGTITVDSAVEKGSTFTVTLPRKRDILA
jgi:PAS domain S-box-containing protein